MLIGKNKRKVGKRALCLVFAFLLSINGFAAIVSDNDGSAFVTKAEFESMKENFASQVANYEYSIDSKIEGAIANYLAGIKLTKKEYLDIIQPGVWECINNQYDSSDYTWRYKYGSPMISMQNHAGGGYYWNTDNGQINYSHFLDAPTYDVNKHAQHKLWIQNLSETNRVAEWFGIGYAARDEMACVTVDSGGNYLNPGTANPVYLAPFRARNYFWKGKLIGNRMTNMGFSDTSTMTGMLYEFDPIIRQVVQDYGTIKNKMITLIGDGKPYRCFALYPTQRNWCFYTTDTTDASSYEKLWQNVSALNQTMDTQVNNCFGTGNYKLRLVNGTSWEARITNNTFTWGTKYSNRSESYGNSVKYFPWPCIGFEENYITNWNQLYTTYFDSIVDDKELITIRDSHFIVDDSGKYHVGLKNGIPLIKVPSENAKVTFEINLKDIQYNINTGAETYYYPSGDSYVWISENPFNGYPNNEECLDFTPKKNCTKTTTANFNKAVCIPASSNGEATVEFEAPNKNKYIWIKWATNGANGSGAITLPSSILVEYE